MKPIDYWRFQLRLEGILLDSYGCIISAAEAQSSPLVLLVQTADGEIDVCVAARLPPPLRDAISAIDPRSCTSGRLLELLRSSGIEAKAETFRTYIFPGSFETTTPAGIDCLGHDDPEVARFGFGDLASPVYALLEAGQIKSACASSRQDAACGEAWVVTDPERRRMGLGSRVVTAWAGALLREGVIPFYSHRIENPASAGLAGRLGLIPVFDETVITATAGV